jgi:hypothetical protein
MQPRLRVLPREATRTGADMRSWDEELAWLLEDEASKLSYDPSTADPFWDHVCSLRWRNEEWAAIEL